MVDQRHACLRPARGRRRAVSSPNSASTSRPAASTKSAGDCGRLGHAHLLEQPAGTRRPSSLDRALGAEPHQPERAALVEHGAHDDAVRQQARSRPSGTCPRSPPPRPRLAQQLGQLGVGREVGRRSGWRTRWRRSRLRPPRGGNELARAVDEVHGQRKLVRCSSSCTTLSIEEKSKVSKRESIEARRDPRNAHRLRGAGGSVWHVQRSRRVEVSAEVRHGRS